MIKRISDGHVALYVGGLSLDRYGTLVRRTAPANRQGESLLESEARNDALGYALDGSGVYLPSKALTSRVQMFGAGTDATLDDSLLLVEPARTNLALQSSNLDDTGSPWTQNGSFTIAAASSGIAGQTAYKHTNGGAAVFRGQVIGTFTGNEEGFAVELENDDALTSDIAIYNVTSAAIVHRATFTWATGAIVTSEGTGKVFARKIADVGPNGGAWWWIGLTATSTVGNSRRVQVWPAGVAASALAAIAHHAELNAVVVPSFSPIVTGGASVTRLAETFNLPYYGPTHTCQVFSKFVELGGSHIDPSVLWHIGGTSSGGRIMVRRTPSVTGYQAASHNGTSLVAVGPVTVPAYGDHVEFLATFHPDGATEAHIALNGGVISGGGKTGLQTPPATFGDALCSIGNNHGIEGGLAGHVVHVVTRGVAFSIDDFRAYLAAT